MIIKLKNSLVYSLQGLGYITKNELSFQLELIYCLASSVTLFFVPIPITQKVIILVTLGLLLSFEIINTVIELIIDHLSPEKSNFAMHCKDLGSATVFIMLMLSFIQWGVFLYPVYFYSFHD